MVTVNCLKFIALSKVEKSQCKAPHHWFNGSMRHHIPMEITVKHFNRTVTG